MKIMKRKVLGILIVMLLIATIPLAVSGKDVQSTALAKKKTFVSGIVFMPPHPALGGTYQSFFAVAMRAGQIGGVYHVYRAQVIFVKAGYSFHGIALPGFILGWFDGPIGLMG